MENLQLNIDSVITELVVEIANLKKDLVLEKAKSQALAEALYAPVTEAPEEA